MMKKRGFGGWWVGGSIVAVSGFFLKHTHTLKTRELRETNYIRVARWWWQCWKCLIKLIKHGEVPKQVGGEHINVYTLLRRCPAAVDRISPDRATWNAIIARRLGGDAAVKSISRRPFRVHKTRTCRDPKTMHNNDCLCLFKRNVAPTPSTRCVLWRYIGDKTNTTRFLHLCRNCAAHPWLNGTSRL